MGTENGINWKAKLSSRKLWAAIVGVVVGLAAAFGINENDYAQVVGVVTSVVSVVSYIFGEAKVDAARALASVQPVEPLPETPVEPLPETPVEPTETE